MQNKEKFQGLKISFHVLNESEVKVELESDPAAPEEDIPVQFINLLSYIRGEQGLLAMVDIVKDTFKSIKRKDLYRTFSMLLKNLALERLNERDAPMISSMEVLGKKRMS